MPNAYKKPLTMKYKESTTKKRLESQVQSAVIKNLESSGWLVIKLIQTTMNGIPDLMCIKSGRCTFIEVKAKGKKETPLQAWVHGRLRKAGIDVFVTDNENFIL